MSYLDILESQMVIDEGKRNRMYPDSEGIPTIGIGHNLRDRPISDRAVRVIFEDDMAVAEADARKLVPGFDGLSDGRKAVLVNMSFNLGYDRLSGFRQFLLAVNEGRWADAAREMLDSLWAKQVGARARRLSDAMVRG